MRGIKQVLQREGVAAVPVSLRRITERFDVKSLRALFAAFDIEHEYRQRGRTSSSGVLGAPVSGIVQTASGTFIRNYQFGTIRSTSMAEFVPRNETEVVYAVDIFIAAVRCFGTEDPGGPFSGGEGEDEPYLVITTINPAHIWLDRQVGNIVKTWRSPIFEGVDSSPGKRIFATELEVFRDLFIGPHGVSLKIALFDHEHGDPDDLRAKIEEKGRAMAREVVQAAGALEGINVDEALADQQMDSAVGRFIQDITFDTLTDLLKDDKIGNEKTWRLPGTMLKEWVDTGFTKDSDVQSADVPSHIKFNFPRENLSDPAWLFEGGGGSYKVFLRVIPKKVDPIIYDGTQRKN